jgi:SAM-dependent methyltransferase
MVHGASYEVGIKQFMESTGRDKVNKLLKEMNRPWVDETGALRPEAVTEQPCPVCSSAADRVAFVKDAFPHKVCAECGMMYVSPILRPNASEVTFRGSESTDKWVDVLLNENQRRFDRPKFEQGLDLLARFARPDQRRVLDIGCGVGHFLELARDRGWEGTGIELNAKAVANCRRLGLDVREELLGADTFPAASFDAVTMWDVLEHVPYPARIIEHIRSVLRPDGLLVVRVPNGMALAARVLQEKCNMFAGFTHINLFSPPTLERFMADQGFAKLFRNTCNPEFNVLNNYLNYDDPYLGESAEREVLLGGLLTGDEVCAKDLGYSILMVARKQG